jgi:hypothetical protein
MQKFVDVSSQAGNGLAPIESSRGSLIDDLDNDGRLDIIVMNSRTRPTLMHNESLPESHWLELQLAGTRGTRDGVGSQVILQAGGKSQILELHSGRGYQSHFGSRLHFGLGAVNKIDKLEIRWHGGEVQELKQLAPNRIYLIRQGHAPVPLEVDN